MTIGLGHTTFLDIFFLAIKNYKEIYFEFCFRTVEKFELQNMCHVFLYYLLHLIQIMAYKE
jgi:hypothetical protein